MTKLRDILGSYRVRVLAGSVAALALVGAAWLWTLYAPLSAAVVARQETDLRAVAQAGALALPAQSPDAQRFATQLTQGTDLRATIVASDGTVLADTQESPAKMENHADRPEIRAALGGQVGVDRRVSRTLGRAYLYVAVPAEYLGSPVALRVSEPADLVSSLTADWRRNGLLLLGVSLTIAIAAAAWLGSRTSASVTRLAETARAMAEGDLTAAVSPEPGELAVLSVALTDLSRQMRARLDDLEAEQRTVRTVLDGLPDALFLLHGEGVRLANRAASALFRQPYGGWRGRQLAECGLPAGVIASVGRAKASSGPLTEECPPDPTGRVLRVTVVPLGAQEGEVRTLVAIADVTERARLDAVRRDFVANASHELKTPTAGIQLLAEAAAAAARDGDDAQAVAFAEQIEGETVRLRHLVLDLLDLSRLETDRADGESANVRDAIELALLGHRKAAAEKGLTLDFVNDASTGDVYVPTDGTDLAVALYNLIDNAITYTERGGVTVRLSVAHGNVEVAVADTGVGIPAADLTRVFERFYRVDRARSRESGGTGLGLALVKHVAERSAGSVEVESTPGAGSTFTLRFPLAG
ncbi:MAG: HAMP domain-containing protein [Actinobacteria bacterium]|nr:MAG: HAMP domain-containing protein [Actinomycetota bacterium]